ncbi:hypothetical protein ACFVT6_08080 [Streptomyces sp. NPDC058049]|uniref:hypothetical protein n=1 Tax=Streptomyces sp. NPDC058049 TaxID=3346314 RepID=UPI0036E20D6F
MRGDETQRGVAPGAESRVVKGPRHAAPRKSLLNKIQIPVGKTMALAAMPTAVFVGMGMAPKLAVADDKEIPFAPGPCVTRSDEPAETESKSPSPTPSTTPSPSTSPSATPSPSASPSAKAKPSTSPSAAKPPVTNEVAPAATPSQDKAKDADTAKSTNPLDPLGVGDALKNLVDELGRPLKDATAKATPTPAPTPSGTATAAPTPTPDPAADAIREAAKKAGVDVKELSEEVKKTEKDPKDETGEGKAKDEAKDDKSKAEDEGKSEDKDEDKAKDEETKDPDGKQPFPCPTYDAKALADAELEQGVPLLPDEPWYLDSSLLTLYGLDYHGIVEVKTAGGKTKKVLKFTADSLDIKDLYQTVGKSGNVAHLKSRPGSTSKIRGGTVTMYTESLKGNLFGLIPIEFTPNSPPPLNVPFAFFTNVKVVQAGQFGGTLTVPGLKNYIGPPE